MGDGGSLMSGTMRFVNDGGRIVLKARGRQADVVDELVRQLGGLIEARASAERSAAPTDPALARLLPDPVHDDPEAAAELRGMIESSLIAHKLRNARTVRESLSRPGPLDEEAELAWLKTLTDLRLVLAARLGIVRDGDAGRYDSDTDRWMQSAYAWLGALQSQLLDAIERRDDRRRA